MNYVFKTFFSDDKYRPLLSHEFAVSEYNLISLESVVMRHNFVIPHKKRRSNPSGYFHFASIICYTLICCLCVTFFIFQNYFHH